MTLQRPYLEAILRFIGFDRIETLVVEPTLLGGPAVAGPSEGDLGEARASMTKPGTAVRRGAWALARFCAPWASNAGEKEKNALPKGH